MYRVAWWNMSANDSESTSQSDEYGFGLKGIGTHSRRRSRSVAQENFIPNVIDGYCTRDDPKAR
jgi:hypothetical protein